MEIKILGAHNTESQNTKCSSLLIDGVLAIDAGGLASSLSFEAQRRLKAILLTHQHYDHVKDIPAIAMNLYLQNTTINIYSNQAVCDALSSHLLDGELYPKFLEQPPGEPTVKFTVIEPLKIQQIAGYSVLAVQVNHPVATIGYQVASPDGSTIFYTGDTGPALTDCWQHISPQLLIIEVTAPNRFEEFSRQSGHLTPSLLERELVSFRELKGYMPRVIAVHINPQLEDEIAGEIAAVSRELGSPITLGYEGMGLSL
jgi:ribonuclease BN (tRNA processing enzyme)